MDEGFIEAVGSSQPDLVFLCNPNNPTGQVVEKPFLRRLLHTMATMENQPLLLLAECFNDFLDQGSQYTMADELANFPNLIILKAFTKMYAMPGLRLGYSLCANKGVNQAIAARRGAFPYQPRQQGCRPSRKKAFPKKPGNTLGGKRPYYGLAWRNRALLSTVPRLIICSLRFQKTLPLGKKWKNTAFWCAAVPTITALGSSSTVLR